MARMHSRKRGKSRSTKPSKKVKPTWTRYKGKEVELLVFKLAKEGNNSSQIGIILRDSYGVPNTKVITGKSIGQILEEKKLLQEIPEDLMSLIKKAINVRKHIESNKHDEPGKRGLILTESKIKRLVKYYKNTERLKSAWKYDPAKIKLQVR